VRTKTCPLFSSRIDVDLVNNPAGARFRYWAEAIEESKIAGPLWLKVRTKTCPLFAAPMSGIIASHVGTETAAVVAAASQRHGLCE
jgi:hypothetical protein